MRENRPNVKLQKALDDSLAIEKMARGEGDGKKRSRLCCYQRSNGTALFWHTDGADGQPGSEQDSDAVTTEEE